MPELFLTFVGRVRRCILVLVARWSLNRFTLHTFTAKAEWMVQICLSRLALQTALTLSILLLIRFAQTLACGWCQLGL
jgi:hypothetical protein